MYNLYFKASLPLKEAAKQETGTTSFPFSMEYTKWIYNGKKFVSNILWCQFCEKYQQLEDIFVLKSAIPYLIR